MTDVSTSSERVTPETDRSVDVGFTPTPRPWPENTIPTNEQMADWLAVCTRWERIAFVQNARHNSERADRCFLENHDGRIKDCERYRRLGQVVPGV